MRNQARSQATEPAVPIQLTITIDGAKTVHTDVAPGSYLELGRLAVGSKIEAEVTNSNGAGRAGASILADNCFRGHDSCEEPDCIARAEYVVSYQRCLD